MLETVALTTKGKFRFLCNSIGNDNQKKSQDADGFKDKLNSFFWESKACPFTNRGL